MNRTKYATRAKNTATDRVLAVDLKGNPYTPVASYSWLDAAARARLAVQYDCDPAEIEYRLDARDRMDAYIAERQERENPFTHRRPGSRALTYAEKVF